MRRRLTDKELHLARLRRTWRSRARWQATVLLQVLVRAGLPVSMHQLGALLGMDHTTLYALLRLLEDLGMVERPELQPDTGAGCRRALYRATPAVRLATGTMER